MGLGTYLRNITDTALTIADGMAVTFSHLVRRPYTVQYPDRLPGGVRVQDTLPFRYRGILEVDRRHPELRHRPDIVGGGKALDLRSGHDRLHRHHGVETGT